jgi:serine O-acetyltransferase
MQSELYGLRLRGLFGSLIAKIFLPFIMLKYKEFWGLRQAALRKGGILKKCYRVYVARYGADIPLTVKFDGPPCLPHGLHGIFIATYSHIGKNVTILQQVTIGQDTFKPFSSDARRYIGDNVFIGAGAKIIGGVVI